MKKTRIDSLTAFEDIAVNIIFEPLGGVYSRSPAEYAALNDKLWDLESLEKYVSAKLKALHESGERLPLICDFKAGDIGRPTYKPFPETISRETIRRGLRKLGFDQRAKARLSS